MAQLATIGSAVAAPPQLSMVDLSWIKFLDSVVFCRSKTKVISASGDRIKAECPLVNSAGDTVLMLSYESTSRRMRQLSAQLRSADGQKVFVEFARPAMESTGSNVVFGSLGGGTKPCEISVGGSHYATMTGSEVMSNLCMQKLDGTGGVKMGKGPSCVCCSAFKANIDDLAGQNVAVVTVDNGMGCPCWFNTMQRQTLALPSEQTTKLDALMLNVVVFAGHGTIAEN